MARKKKKSPARAKPAKKRRAMPKRRAVKAATGPKRAKAKTRKTKPAKAVRKVKSARKEVLGEGNYTASRNFRKSETAFVQRNKRRIPKLGKEAQAALEGPEGKDLLAAEAEARSHSHVPGTED